MQIKERQLQQTKSEELQRQQYQQWLAENFSQDGETGKNKIILSLHRVTFGKRSALRLETINRFNS